MATRGRPKGSGAYKKRELTPDEERLKKAGLPTQVYHNNMFQVAGMDVEEGEEMNANTKIITKNLEIMNLPAIDLMDADAVRSRINEYFSIEARWGFKPTVSGLGSALGLDRRRLWEIRNGTFGNVRGMVRSLPADVMDLIKKTYIFLEQSWEDYMQNGKINPVAGIFLGKNLYGYQDKTEYVITPNTDGTEYSEADIRARLGLPESTEDGDG